MMIGDWEVTERWEYLSYRNPADAGFLDIHICRSLHSIFQEERVRCMACRVPQECAGIP